MGESRKLIWGSLSLLIGLLGLCGNAVASPVPVTNPWLDQRGILNMAHQGGEFEAPSSTMYAFRTALVDRGADSLEMDVNVTSDDRLAVMHDYYTAKITPADAQVRSLTLAQLQALDAAWWFSPGSGQFDHSKAADQYPFRGVRTGDVAPPQGFTADDFRVPTIEEVLAAFPKVPLNIEIKAVPGEPQQSIRSATLLATILNRPENSNRRIIVASLDQNALIKFHELAPQVDLSASLTSMISFIGSGAPIEPNPVALQVPMVLGELDVPSVLKEMNVAGKDYAVHAWTDGEQTENDASYARLIESGVQGIMSSSPSLLADYLCRSGNRRPDGAPRCKSQVMDYRLNYPTRSLKRFLRSGMTVKAACSERCGMDAKLWLKAAAAKRIGIKAKPNRRGLVRIGVSQRISPYAPAGNPVRVSTYPQSQRRLSRVRRVSVLVETTLYDSYGWQRSVDRRWLTLAAKKPSAVGR